MKAKEDETVKVSEKDFEKNCKAGHGFDGPHGRKHSEKAHSGKHSEADREAAQDAAEKGGAKNADGAFGSGAGSDGKNAASGMKQGGASESGTGCEECGAQNGSGSSSHCGSEKVCGGEGSSVSDAEKIEALTKENADLKDQLLRRAADFDNYRKRMLKEKQDAFDYANTNLLQDLLESLDNFDRSLEAAKNATDIKAIVEGIKMVSGNLVSMLENKYGLISYGNAGDSFNPDEHEAIGSGTGPVASPVLKDVFLKGYKLKDRIIRHAKVSVMMPDGSVSDKAEGANGTNAESAANTAGGGS
ncbi:nucleotide exchange factor GrpE [Treponema parvum]|uniref:nucleotide exchange factor GrpE n=1 Tax=Treponema parvum TaxID=138851 RepID=UPI00211E2514|nr:nucleotide exchange factor GrpE [Treponema parvum]